MPGSKKYANNKKSASKFKVLADGLSHIKKITAKVADMAKFQYNKFQKVFCEKHHSEFDAFDFGKDRLGVLLGSYISDKKELWHIVNQYLFYHKSYVERGFSISKELIDTNMKEKSLVVQRLIYDKLLSEDSKCCDFVITANLRKSCVFGSKRYEDDLGKQKTERTNMENFLKRKAMVDEIEAFKRRKQETEQIVKKLRKTSDTELLKADEKQADVARSKVAPFQKAVMQKEKVLESLTISQSKIETDLKTVA